MPQKTLIAASSVPILLSVLAQGESYGYAILARVRALSDGNLDWNEGMLYPVLHRLERNGLVAAEWRDGDSGRQRKYYHLTQKGRGALAHERAEWSQVNATLEALWAGGCRV